MDGLLNFLDNLSGWGLFVAVILIFSLALGVEVLVSAPRAYIAYRISGKEWREK